MLSKKIPFYSAVLSLLSGVFITLFFLNRNHNAAIAENAPDKQVAGTEIKPGSDLAVSRQSGFSLINPLLSVKHVAESDKLGDLKVRIANLIEDDKRTGLLSSASVYLYSLPQGDWIYVAPGEPYHPGSLMKVPIMMTYLKMAEKDPQIFTKKIFYNKPADLPVQTFEQKSLKPGQSYTVKELLQYMIEYSDNNATRLLNENADLNILKKIFTDLNLAEPNLSDMYYQTNARDYSEFMTVLYNASYLSRTSSEYAMELLCNTDFKEGMLKELPANVKVAHKFGEWGDLRMNIHELHESGVVYLNGKPYILTIMTKGNAPKELPQELSKVSKMVYDYFAASM